jgi:hypothetical protein
MIPPMSNGLKPPGCGSSVGVGSTIVGAEVWQQTIWKIPAAEKKKNMIKTTKGSCLFMVSHPVGQMVNS